MNKSIDDIIKEVQETMTPKRKSRKYNTKEEVKEIAKEEVKYKYCYEAIQEFSDQYHGIRKYATLWELQLRLTNKIWRYDDMWWCTKEAQDQQIRWL